MDCYITFKGSSVSQERTACQNRTLNSQLLQGKGSSAGRWSGFESWPALTVCRQSQRRCHKFNAKEREVSQSIPRGVGLLRNSQRFESWPTPHALPEQGTQQSVLPLCESMNVHPVGEAYEQLNVAQDSQRLDHSG
jgi:hypothetical protein